MWPIWVNIWVIGLVFDIIIITFIIITINNLSILELESIVLGLVPSRVGPMWLLRIPLWTAARELDVKIYFNVLCVWNPNSYGRKQKFWYQRNGKTTYTPCSHCFFGRTWDQMGKKCQYLANKANFGPNLAVYGPKTIISRGVSKSFGTLITEKLPRQLVRIVSWSGIGSPGPKMPLFGQFWVKFWTKMCFFYPKIWIFGAKSQFLYGNREFCQRGISPVSPATTFPFRPPQKNLRSRAMGHFSGLTPVFGRFGPFPNH